MRFLKKSLKKKSLKKIVKIPKLKNYFNQTVLLFNVSSKIIYCSVNNGDEYIIKPNEYKQCLCSNLEIKARKSNNEKVLFQKMFIDNTIYVLFGIEDLLNGKSSIYSSPLFTNFLIANGIPDSSQFMNSIGLNDIILKIGEPSLKKVFIDEKFMIDFVYLLIKHWDIVKKIFSRKNNKTLSINDQIPKIVNWIWLKKDIDSREEMKNEKLDLHQFSKFITSWMSLNPGYTFKLWTNYEPENVNQNFSKKIQVINIFSFFTSHDFINKKGIRKMIFKAPNVALRSDTLRQFILLKYGGIYADINDLECLKSFDFLCENFSYLCGTEPMLYCNNAIIACKPKHFITKRIVKFMDMNCEYIFTGYKELMKDSNNEDFRNILDGWIISKTGPKFYSEILFGFLDEFFSEKEKSEKEKKSQNDIKNVLIGPSKMFYPNYKTKQQKENWICPFSYTAHYDQRSFI